MRKIKTLLLGLLVGFGISLTTIVHADAKPIYDISQWQTPLTAQQVSALKSEVSFLILRVQDGTAYQDTAFQQNVQLLNQANIPYGVYSFSRYTSVTGAQQEANQLYNTAPHARFYVNDVETNNGLNNSQLDKATNAWVQTIKKRTKQPVIMYSGLDFLQHHLMNSRKYYHAIWLADYTNYEPNPNFHYDLWQYTDSQYSPALAKKLDASIIPSGGKPLSFWLKQRVQHIKKQLPIKKATKKLKFNPKYYSDYHIKQLKVIAKKGVTVYNFNNHALIQLNYGDVVAVQKFIKVGHIQRAVTPNGNYFSANKKLVGQVH